jgi:hypothetical protein
MSNQNLEKKENVNSPKGESFHDSQTESDSTYVNQNPKSKNENIPNQNTNNNNNDTNNNLNTENKNEEQNDNIDNIAFDKKFWNFHEFPFPDLALKKETTNESKLSIDTPDISKQRLKEFLNEDLLNAIDVSPMVTPKSKLKDAANENNNDNNNENIIHINEDLMSGNSNDLFQFSLYNNNSGNNKNENDNNINKENNDIKSNPIDELIKNSEKNEDQNKIKTQKEEDDFNDNKIMENFNFPNFNLNNMKSISETNDLNSNEINNNNIINNEIKHNFEDEGGGKQINIIKNNEKDSPKKINNIPKDKNNNTIPNFQTESTNTNKINSDFNQNININNNINKFNQNIGKKNEEEDNNKNLNNPTKKHIPLQVQHSYMPHMAHFPFGSQQHIIQVMQPNIHENKFDGNKKYNLVIPIQIKKNPKMKRHFEVREGDWTCSDCGNLNFAFRVKCNRCGISKELSEEKKANNSNNEKEQGNKNTNINNTNNANNNNNYYSNINMMPYKGVVFQSPLYNKGETFYPKYYSGYIYVPVQGQYMKNTQEKKIQKEEKNYIKNEQQKEKEKEKNTNNNANNEDKNNESQKEEDKKEEDHKK